MRDTLYANENEVLKMKLKALIEEGSICRPPFTSISDYYSQQHDHKLQIATEMQTIKNHIQVLERVKITCNFIKPCSLQH